MISWKQFTIYLVCYLICKCVIEHFHFMIFAAESNSHIRLPTYWPRGASVQERRNYQDCRQAGSQLVDGRKECGWENRARPDPQDIRVHVHGMTGFHRGLSWWCVRVRRAMTKTTNLRTNLVQAEIDIMGLYKSTNWYVAFAGQQTPHIRWSTSPVCWVYHRDNYAPPPPEVFFSSSGHECRDILELIECWILVP